MPDQPTTTGRMARGTVKWFNVEKGFGFIGVETGEHAGRDFFVHHTAIEDRSRVLQDGQPVEFDIVTGPKGPQAANVVAVGNAPPTTAPKPEALGDALKHLKAAQSIIEREARKLTTSAEP